MIPPEVLKAFLADYNAEATRVWQLAFDRERKPFLGEWCGMAMRADANAPPGEIRITGVTYTVRVVNITVEEPVTNYVTTVNEILEHLNRKLLPYK